MFCSTLPTKQWYSIELGNFLSWQTVLLVNLFSWIAFVEFVKNCLIISCTKLRKNNSKLKLQLNNHLNNITIF